MEFSILAESFNKMESTRKRLELTQFLDISNSDFYSRLHREVKWSFQF